MTSWLCRFDYDINPHFKLSVGLGSNPVVACMRGFDLVLWSCIPFLGAEVNLKRKMQLGDRSLSAWCFET